MWPTRPVSCRPPSTTNLRHQGRSSSHVALKFGHGSVQRSDPGTRRTSGETGLGADALRRVIKSRLEVVGGSPERERAHRPLLAVDPLARRLELRSEWEERHRLPAPTTTCLVRNTRPLGSCRARTNMRSNTLRIQGAARHQSSPVEAAAAAQVSPLAGNSSRELSDEAPPKCGVRLMFRLGLQRAESSAAIVVVDLERDKVLPSKHDEAHSIYASTAWPTYSSPSVGSVLGR